MSGLWQANPQCRPSARKSQRQPSHESAGRPKSPTTQLRQRPLKVLRGHFRRAIDQHKDSRRRRTKLPAQVALVPTMPSLSPSFRQFRVLESGETEPNSHISNQSQPRSYLPTDLNKSANTSGYCTLGRAKFFLGQDLLQLTCPPTLFQPLKFLPRFLGKLPAKTHIPERIE